MRGDAVNVDVEAVVAYLFLLRASCGLAKYQALC